MSSPRCGPLVDEHRHARRQEHHQEDGAGSREERLGHDRPDPQPRPGRAGIRRHAHDRTSAWREASTRAAPQPVEQQEPGRPEQERQGQARQHQEERDPLAPRRPDLPGAEEEVEREIVDPAGQRDLRHGEERHHLGERAEPARRPRPEREHQPGIGDREQERHDQPGDPLRPHRRTPAEDEDAPTRQREHVDRLKDDVVCHRSDSHLDTVKIFARTARACQVLF